MAGLINFFLVAIRHATTGGGSLIRPILNLRARSLQYPLLHLMLP
jgi:hypothetical protein